MSHFSLPHIKCLNQQQQQQKNHENDWHQYFWCDYSVFMVFKHVFLVITFRLNKFSFLFFHLFSLHLFYANYKWFISFTLQTVIQLGQPGSLLYLIMKFILLKSYTFYANSSFNANYHVVYITQNSTISTVVCLLLFQFYFSFVFFIFIFISIYSASETEAHGSRNVFIWFN